jgi:hypothetical protein
LSFFCSQIVYSDAFNPIDVFVVHENGLEISEQINASGKARNKGGGGVSE